MQSADKKRRIRYNGYVEYIGMEFELCCFLGENSRFLGENSPLSVWKQEKPTNGKTACERCFWRSGWDSNPRYPQRYKRFRVVLVMTASIPLPIFIFTSALKSLRKKERTNGEN